MKYGTLATRVVAATAAAALTTATAQAAPIVRASSSIPAAKSVVTVRQGRTVQSKDNLLGAPLFLVFLGAVVVVVGTIIITKSKG